MAYRGTNLYQFFSTNGDGTGTLDASADYSDLGAGLTEFKITPPAGKVYSLERMMACVSDGQAVDSGFYGDGITLTNGVVVYVKDAEGVILDVTGGVPILTNSDWCRLAGPDVNPMGWGQGVAQLAVRFTFSKGGLPIIADGDMGQYFSLDLNDSFAALDSHYFEGQGQIIGHTMFTAQETDATSSAYPMHGPSIIQNTGARGAACVATETSFSDSGPWCAEHNDVGDRDKWIEIKRKGYYFIRQRLTGVTGTASFTSKVLRAS